MVGVVQRIVTQERRGDNRGKWHSPRDEDTYFDTKEDALDHHRALVNAEVEKKKKREKKAKEKKVKAFKKALKQQYKDYKPPDSDTVLVFKNADTEYDEVSLTRVAKDSIKKFMENLMTQRWAKTFKTNAIELGGRYFILTAGTDIGITPAVMRPDLSKTHKNKFCLSRNGTAKPYKDLARDLDEIVGSRVTRKRKWEDVRSRVGKDIDRLTRNSAFQGDLDYTEGEKDNLSEFSAIIRLDKARVPKATRYIRRSLTSSETFEDLLVKQKYVGAHSVKKLRDEIVDRGEESEGSDIEDEPPKKKRKRNSSPRTTINTV